MQRETAYWSLIALAAAVACLAHFWTEVFGYGAPFLVEKTTKKHGRQILCNNEECDYARSEALPETAA